MEVIVCCNMSMRNFQAHNYQCYPFRKMLPSRMHWKQISCRGGGLFMSNPCRFLLFTRFLDVTLTSTSDQHLLENMISEDLGTCKVLGNAIPLLRKQEVYAFRPLWYSIVPTIGFTTTFHMPSMTNDIWRPEAYSPPLSVICLLHIDICYHFTNKQ